jgi:hypothetical protein
MGLKTEEENNIIFDLLDFYSIPRGKNKPSRAVFHSKEVVKIAGCRTGTIPF